MLLILPALAMIYFTGLFLNQSRVLDSLATRLGYRGEEHYAVVVDAGSSGSRVLAYRFRVPFTIGKYTLELVEEYYKAITPGLSSYADDPQKGAQIIASLVRSADALVPAARRGHSPLLVRATAGLRMLPAAKAEILIKNVLQALVGLGYPTNGDTVKIMDGSDEGIYIWYSVNLLHDTMYGSESLAALDLGGGSTQITYRAAGDEPARDCRVVRTGYYNTTVFTHSFLNLGLNAARYGVLALGSAAAGRTRKLHSICIGPKVRDMKWVYRNQEYLVSGLPRASGAKPSSWYAACREAARAHVLAARDYEPERAPPAAIAAMSEYYYVAADYGIIDGAAGGTTDVAGLRAAAGAACAEPAARQPWACLDLAYIVTLLHDLYKIKDTEPIMLFEKVDGHEVSWALGLAYTTVMNQIADSGRE